MNEIACANCGEPVLPGGFCHECGYRDETSWPAYQIGDDNAEPSGSDEATWREWIDSPQEGGGAGG